MVSGHSELTPFHWHTNCTVWALTFSSDASKAQKDPQSGALNGTKIALVTQSFATDNRGGSEEEIPDYTSQSSGRHDDLAKREHQQTRLSAYSFSNLPEVVPTDTYAGKVVVHDDHKEAIAKPEKETVSVQHIDKRTDEEHGKEVVPSATGTPLAQKLHLVKGRSDRRLCGIRAKWFLLGIALLILFIVVLGIGLGVGLRSQ